MKRLLILLLICMLSATLACAKKTEPESVPAVTAPAAAELTMRLPFGARTEVAKTFYAYTAGFASANGEPLFFTASSADPAVAEGVLKENGTLYVIAHGTGETKITVSAKTLSGEQASSVISVTVRDARRTVALIALGLLAVALLILLGKPAQKKSEPAAEAPAAPETPETPEETGFPVAIFEDAEEKSNENPERS